MKRLSRGRRWGVAIAALLVALVASDTVANASRHPSAPEAAPQQGAVDNWTTYHYTQTRQGYDGQATKATGHLTSAWATTLDGAVYGEPLVINGTVIAATENDTLYALSLTGSVLWKVHVGTPVPLSELLCGDIDPLGITGTPMYDAATDQIYFVAELDNPIRHQLYAVDLSTGKIAWSRSVDPQGSVPSVEQQRGAMAIAQGRVWVSYGALAGDCGDYHGYEIGSLLSGTGALSVYRTPSTRGAGIWAPTGPSVDPQGHLFVAPANGAAFAPPYDDSDSIVKLDGSTKVSLWAPTNWAHENADDQGQGPAAPLLFNALGQRWGFVTGKAGHIYLLHQGDLGGIGGQAAQGEGCAAFGGSAFHAGTLFVPCTNGMAAYTIAAGPAFKQLWHTTATAYGADPVVGGGAVWAASDGNLLQLDPSTGSTVATIAIGASPHFATPSLHGSLVLVGTMVGVTAISTG